MRLRSERTQEAGRQGTEVRREHSQQTTSRVGFGRTVCEQRLGVMGKVLDHASDRGHQNKRTNNS